MELPFAEQVDAVLRISVDAGFARAPLQADARIRAELVLAEPRCVLVSSRHRLAGRSSW